MDDTFDFLRGDSCDVWDHNYVIGCWFWPLICKEDLFQLAHPNVHNSNIYFAKSDVCTKRLIHGRIYFCTKNLRWHLVTTFAVLLKKYAVAWFFVRAVFYLDKWKPYCYALPRVFLLLEQFAQIPVIFWFSKIEL